MDWVFRKLSNSVWKNLRSTSSSGLFTTVILLPLLPFLHPDALIGKIQTLIFVQVFCEILK